MVGVRTLVPRTMLSVVAAAAPSQGRTPGAWPPLWRHGWRWSETPETSKPRFSACCHELEQFTGPNCSLDAL